MRRYFLGALFSAIALAASEGANNYIGTNNGNWAVAANWSSNAVPTANDDVVINNKAVLLDDTGTVKSLTLLANAFLSIAGGSASGAYRAPKDPVRTDPVGISAAGDVLIVGSKLHIGGLNQLCSSYLTVGGSLLLSNNTANAELAIYSGYKGPTNAVATYKTGGARVTVAGGTVLGGTHISNTSVIYPYCHRASGAPVVFDLHDLIVDTQGRFEASDRGHSLSNTTYYGLGQGRANGGGGGYGGYGGGVASNTAGVSYGFAFAPYFPGSPGRLSEVIYGAGGGAIRIIAGNVLLNGYLLANGANYWNSSRGAGSGGGIWVTCTNFTAGSKAIVSARGGSGTDGIYTTHAAGGGGRVAILTGAPTAGQIDALYDTGQADGLIVMPMNESPYPSLTTVAGGLNLYDTANEITNLYNGQPGTAYWMINKADAFQVAVSGNPVATDAAVPAYGKNKIASGNFDASVVSPGLVAGSGGNSRMTCTGYAWSNATAQTGSGSGTNVTLTVTNDVWLTWNWSTLEHRLSARSAGNGSLSAYDEWQAAGGTCALTATPDSGCSFLYWVGDVPYAARTNPVLSLTMDAPRKLIACFTAGAAGARNLTWAGGAGTNDWFNPANWDNTAIPGVYDSVTITNGTNLIVYPADITLASLTLVKTGKLYLGCTGSAANACWPVNAAENRPFSLTVSNNMVISNSAQFALGGLNASSRVDLAVGGNLLLDNTGMLAIYAAYTGPTNDVATYKNGGAKVRVDGTTTLAGTSWVYPFCHQMSGAPVIFAVQDVWISTNAGINAKGWGFASFGGYDYRYGPGAPTGINTGGSHGGLGGGSSRPVYGYAFAPYWAGSPGRLNHAGTGMGGGAIRILGRSIRLDGRLLAEGADDTAINYGAGSGGSVWITCSNFTAGASAAIRAVGGNAQQHSSCGAGGGGRVAIMTDMPTGEQLDSLYATGLCAYLVVTTTNMSDPEKSPYPSLVYVNGGTNWDQRTVPSYATHGKPGTAVWLQNKGDKRQLTVSGSPVALGTAQPVYGISTVPVGSNDCTVSSPAFVADSAERSRLNCTGYSWSNAIAQTGSGSGASATLDITDETWLTWFWGGLEHRLTVRSGGNGSVTQDYADWYTNGSSCTLTAVPDANCSFLYWVGDVPDADRLAAQITLTMDRPRVMIACFTAAAPGARALTWAGGAGTNDWFNPAYWDGAAIPGIHDSVTITNGQSLIGYPGEFTLASLSISNVGKLFIGGRGSEAIACAPLNAAETRPYRLTVSGNMFLTNSAQFAMGGLNATARVELAVGGDLTMGASAQLAMYPAYAGPTNALATYQAGGGRVTVSGTTTLSGTSWIYPFCDQRSGAPVIFDLQDLNVVSSNCGFDASYHGFGRELRITPSWVYVNYGPGPGTNNVWGQQGGSYGGQGGGSNNVTSCGLANAPYLPGSPGLDPVFDTLSIGGGGAIRIQARNVLLNGQFKAVGYGRNYAGAGSGGGIWVTCDRFDMGPVAMLDAQGGNASYYSNCGGGGGGRIAVGLKLAPDRIDSLYATGATRGQLVQNMADLPPFMGKFTVAGGLSQWWFCDPLVFDGKPGTAVFVTAPAVGTLMILY